MRFLHTNISDEADFDLSKDFVIFQTRSISTYIVSMMNLKGILGSFRIITGMLFTLISWRRNDSSVGKSSASHAGDLGLNPVRGLIPVTPTH